MTNDSRDVYSAFAIGVILTTIISALFFGPHHYSEVSVSDYLDIRNMCYKNTEVKIYVDECMNDGKITPKEYSEIKNVYGRTKLKDL